MTHGLSENNKHVEKKKATCGTIHKGWWYTCETSGERQDSEPESETARGETKVFCCDCVIAFPEQASFTLKFTPRNPFLRVFLGLEARVFETFALMKTDDELGRVMVAMSAWRVFPHQLTTFHSKHWEPRQHQIPCQNVAFNDTVPSQWKAGKR